jgi:hypothetical protein
MDGRPDSLRRLRAAAFAPGPRCRLRRQEAVSRPRSVAVLRGLDESRQSCFVVATSMPPATSPDLQRAEPRAAEIATATHSAASTRRKAAISTRPSTPLQCHYSGHLMRRQQMAGPSPRAVTDAGPTGIALREQDSRELHRQPSPVLGRCLQRFSKRSARSSDLRLGFGVVAVGAKRETCSAPFAATSNSVLRSSLLSEVLAEAQQARPCL